MTISLADVFSASRRIASIAADTPLVPSVDLASRFGRDFLLKLETAQPVGAFKLRGAVNAVCSLPDGINGVTCCSTGNHGRGVAFAARARGINAVICMSSLVPKAKINGIKALGAEVRIVGQSQDDALMESQRLAESDGIVEISPFDDPLVIAGQGTIGLELLRTRPDLSNLLVPLSGGGLAAGVAVAAKAIKPDIRIIGVSMDRGAAMYASIAAGHPVEVNEVPSLADSLGGGIGLQNRLSFPLCSNLLDDIVLVTEKEIYRAMQAFYYCERMVAEGASVVGIAAMLAGKAELAPGPVATIITGRNVDMSIFTDVISGRDVQLGSETIRGEVFAGL